MIMIKHQIMSHDRFRILLAHVIGGERVLFAPGNLATLKIILLLSDIIRMTPSLVCHCFIFFIMFPEDYLEEVFIPETNKGMSVPMDLQELIKWVGCWLYMVC